ncbi:ABC transporter permease [Leifsonia sp. fls2-241-R2A-40a]|uniref:ABC transporter permease n=1 Tax=Leifsonia sp. fls2-241-R2A-40a TaxID=3040290 RepID=UPI00254CDDBD|nr:ABC transporter permease [Leifsonia sp. fls2-241-R2A-40a]
MTFFNTALISGRLGYRALFAWNTPALFVASLLITPALQTIFFVTLGNANGYGSQQFFITGNAVQATAAAGVGGMVSVIADERRFGTLSALLASPAPRTAVFVGRLIPGVVCGIAVSVVISVFGFLVAGLPFPPEDIGLYAVAVVLAAFSCSTLGLALSAFGLIYRDIYQLATGTYLVMLVTSGANIASSDLPAPLAWIGAVLPSSHAIEGIRSLSGAGTGDYWVQCGVETCVAVIWLVMSLVLLRHFEQQARATARVDLS